MHTSQMYQSIERVKKKERRMERGKEEKLTDDSIDYDLKHIEPKIFCESSVTGRAPQFELCTL